jgi:hypothetical protein
VSIAGRHLSVANRKDETSSNFCDQASSAWRLSSQVERYFSRNIADENRLENVFQFRG